MSQPMLHSVLIVILYSALRVMFVVFTVAPAAFCLIHKYFTLYHVMNNSCVK